MIELVQSIVIFLLGIGLVLNGLAVRRMIRAYLDLYRLVMFIMVSASR